MTDSVSHRWRHFTAEEKQVIQCALAQLCEEIMDGVKPDSPPDALRCGALAFLTAHEVLFSIDDHLGRAHPSQDVVAKIASLIVDGDVNTIKTARDQVLGEAA